MSAHTLHAVDELSKHNESFYHDDLSTYSKVRFRILGINPGKFHDSISCRLRSLPIRQDLAYGALSYAWASHIGGEEITLNGQPGFKVTASVAGAIRRLRHHDRVRCLWVDAICVNQANIRERSQQVALMADIFRFAELVYVWLGGCSGTTGLESVTEIETCDRHQIDWDGTFKLIKAGQVENDPFCDVQIGKIQWWWRTWAVQEVALGRKIAVLIGPHQLSWSKAKEALEYCWLRSPWTAEVDRERFREAYQQLDQLQTVRGKRAWVCSYLRYLLQLTASHAASDPRDKIYGVLGLLEINKPGGVGLVPDYSKTYEEVCRDATLHLIQSEESLDVLLEDWRGLQQEPFWALDFAGLRRHPQSLLQREVNYLDSPRSTGNELMCCASKDSKASFRLEGQHLKVYGIHFDTIETVVRFDEKNLGRFVIEPTTFMDNEDLLQFAQNGERKVSLGASNDPWAALQSLELLAKHLHPNPIDVANVNMPLRVLDISEQFARTITGDRYAEAFRLQMATSQLYREYAWATLRGRTFFLTEQGFCGVGAPEIGVGDAVAVLFGASMPAVLRGHVFGEWRLVGECYISGIM
jgi:hypothetical protein